MPLLFPIETGNRETISKLFIACKFAEKGYVSYIGTKIHIFNIIKYLKQPVYFDKGYHQGVSERIHNKIKEQNGIIVSLDEEIGVDLNDFSTLSKRFPEKAIKIFDLIFLWGTKQDKYLRERRNNYNPKKVFVTGHPRFELLRDKYQSLYSSMVEDIKSKYGKYILINTNFGFGNNLLGDDFVIKNYLDRVPNIKEHIQYEKCQLNHFIELIKDLQNFFKMNIVIRPHPEEDNYTYIEKLNKYNNVFIKYEKSAIPWILGCEVMIHHSCTTALEAVMLEKTPISYIKDVDEKLIPWIPLKISLKFSKSLEIIELIEKGKYKNVNSTKNNRQILSDYFSFFNNTTDQIIEECDKLFKTKDYQNHQQLRGLLYYSIKSKSKVIIKRLLKYLYKSNDNKLGSQKRKGFDINTINNLLYELKKNKFIDRDIKINAINELLFKVYK
ncbi:MAG: hypothetical protein ISR80_05695 [Nitrosopumilus sp.]|nr:hypothetical protein [Nitrosopumilus sp.]